MAARNGRGSSGGARRRPGRVLVDEPPDRLRRELALCGSHTTSGWRGRFQRQPRGRRREPGLDRGYCESTFLRRRSDLHARQLAHLDRV